MKFKEDIKIDLTKDIKNLLSTQKIQIKEELKNYLEAYIKNIKINDNNGFENKETISVNKEKINELNVSVEELTQRMNYIQENRNKQNETNITKRMDNFDIDFDRLIKSLKR